jgi:hypothetical protein
VQEVQDGPRVDGRVPAAEEQDDRHAPRE